MGWSEEGARFYADHIIQTDLIKEVIFNNKIIIIGLLFIVLILSIVSIQIYKRKLNSSKITKKIETKSKSIISINPKPIIKKEIKSPIKIQKKKAPILRFFIDEFESTKIIPHFSIF